MNDLNSKISMQRVMNMTLDEYIKESGLFRTPIPPPYTSPYDPEETSTEEGEIMVKQEADEEMNSVFDLRTKISSNNPEQPNVRSQQWRLLPPNQSLSRPLGMPPLVPNDIESIQLNNSKQFTQNNKKWGNRRNRNNRNRWQQQPNHRNNGYTEYNSQQKLMNKRTNYQQLLNNFRGKIAMGVGRRDGLDHSNQHHRQSNQTNDLSVLNMTIEAGSDNSRFNRNTSNSNPFAANQPLQSGVMSTSSLGILQPLNFLNESGGINVDLMPFIAEKILEALQVTSIANTPKYDLKVQKEIHMLQKKTMTYKCPGGDVVSTDGPGLPCKMTPASTGISLNQRFA